MQIQHEINDNMICGLLKNDRQVTFFKTTNLNDATPNRSQLPNDKDFDSSSKFEMIKAVSSSLETLPLTFEQQALLQTMSSHLLKLNDYLRSEKMIIEVFKEDIEKELNMELGFPLEIEFLDREPKALLDIKNTLFANLPQVNAALTAPSTHHMQNYERLEIYGDTVISLLVVLEIYVLRNQMDTQNELDI